MLLQIKTSYLNNFLANFPIFFLLLYTPFCKASSESELYKPFDKWVEIERPKGKDTTPTVMIWRTAAKESKFYWVVSNESNKIKVSRHIEDKYTKPLIISNLYPPVNLPTPVKQLADTKDVGYGYIYHPVNDGWLVSYHMGEWGGKLWWFSKDAKTEILLSSNHQVSKFFDINNEMYATEGTDHMGGTSGSIIKIIKKDDTWTVNTAIECPENPKFIVPYKKLGFLIAFSKSFGVFTKEYGLKILSKNVWTFLNPTSIALSYDESKAYVGIYQYVSEVDLNSGKVRYLIPGQSFLNKLSPKKIDKIKKIYGIQ